MLWLVARRLLIAVPLLVAVSLAMFLLMQLIPGDAAAAIAGDRATPRVVEQVRARLGIDRPLHRQYLDWLTAAFRGDLGTSLFNSQPVKRSIVDRLPATLSLTLSGSLIAITAGFGAGIAAARRPGSIFDRVVSGVAATGLAMPTFWLGLILIYVFTFRFDWLPPTGYVALTDDPVGWLKSIAMPSIALGVPSASVVARQTRSAFIDVLRRDYIKAARARGAGSWSVLLQHGLKNAAAPIATVFGLEVIAMFGGSIIIEQLFNIPGIGALTVDAVQKRDLTVVQGVVVVIGLFVVLTNLVVDLIYGYTNPRGRRR